MAMPLLWWPQLWQLSTLLMLGSGFRASKLRLFLPFSESLCWVLMQGTFL